MAMALLTGLMLFFDYFLSPLLSHSIKEQRLVSLPCLSAYISSRLEALWVGQIWDPQTKDNSFCSWYVAFYFIHFTKIEPLLCSSHCSRFLCFPQKKMSGNLDSIISFHYDVKCQHSVKQWVRVWLNTELLFKAIFTLWFMDVPFVCILR